MNIEVQENFTERPSQNQDHLVIKTVYLQTGFSRFTQYFTLIKRTLLKDHPKIKTPHY